MYCRLFFKILKEEKKFCLIPFPNNLHELFGLPSMHPNATWHFQTALIFQYYDQRLVMQAAWIWIISVHLMEAWLFETSPVLGLRGAGRSKNTISQVVSHELKIAEHNFPVQAASLPPKQTHLLLTPTYLHSPPCSTHSVSWQKAAFPPTWWRNLTE